MWPLGHAAIAYLCYTVSTRARFDSPPAPLPVLIVLFGSQFPDLVDKPLAWYLGVLPTGRTLAHSLLLLVPLSLAIYALARHAGRAEYGIAFAIGAISHALVDALPVLWGGTSADFLLWPLIPVESYESGAPTILGLLFDSLGDPYFLSEFVIAALAFVMWRRDGYPGLEIFSRPRSEH
ncbi:metal-dependent hydrolase [Natrarchaeobius halalkaliphilus]|uniref:Metal-dependent hydrolase n=1 Tax=Natrarchaeobius halalkaliphilus TaxID=1679091 RepID=A0A3N6LJY2_9EURY|nr:metal-dependent hydrolase [Natrarchaeobius halalkaliphilus]RQG86658.1 metal-dependent hydrolase [Natrarchaeobius halalkaliphilus]